ncbi:cell wall-binding protein [Methylomonas sp. ZR1]|uniref:cell wall-binding protein n=1 Tax=Methylomonas sp. ZR1 TaxID=1797072 RepID=UPI001491D1B0|nr:cell wall-binding protein [Methylomonas sp. ZR1]NOV28958.1 cell wall-binding protein [Methylomonas sp. ZR1]
MSDKPKTPPILEVVNGAKKPPTAKKAGTQKPTGNGGGGSGGGRSTPPEKFGEYLIKNGAFHQSRAVKAGPDGSGFVEFPLCDFVCSIKEEVTAEDGLNDAAFLRIEGRRGDGLPLPAVDVPAKSFFSSQACWPNEAWGSRVFVYPGTAKRDNLRAAVHQFSRLSGDIPRRVVYRFTGWKKIDGAWHYLTGSGAMTAAGLIDGVQVDLGPGNMGRYALPTALAGDDLKQAVADAMLLLDVAPSRPHIGAALLAAVARAPLGECQQTDFAVWLHGLTGSRKSALAAIAQAFYGDFTARSFPANWSDSANDAEAKSHQSKDGVFCIDDFRPSVNRVEAEKQHAMAERIIRGTGNGAGRGRRTANMQAQAAPFNRSMMIVTAEDLPRGQSLLGRLLILELGRADVDNPTLSKLQHAAQAGRFPGLMSAYLQWLAPRMDRLKAEFPKVVEQLRNAAIRDGFASSHPRAPEIYSNLLGGAETFMEFLEDAGTLTSEQANVVLAELENCLKQAFSEQGAYQTEQDEVERFLQLLRAAFSSGNGHIATVIKQGPPVTRPFSWGWRSSGKDLNGDDMYKPMGDCCGWYAEPRDAQPAEVWMEPNTAFKIVQEFARHQGDSFLISAGSLWRRMAERGLLLKMEHDGGGKPRPTIKRTIAGRSVRVLVLDAGLVESG